ncbi:MAG: hypothetical protein LBQ24_00040 [Candidatus Peribacteria bacterium]|jgi:hypothetical protein|nr:hypothetical protein [Candidatus Peribacteria bacterium]
MLSTGSLSPVLVLQVLFSIVVTPLSSTALSFLKQEVNDVNKTIKDNVTINFFIITKITY